MSRRISILLITAACLMLFSASGSGSQYLTLHQEVWLQTNLSLGPAKWMPHPVGPTADGNLEFLSAILAHKNRKDDSPHGNISVGEAITYPDTDCGAHISTTQTKDYSSIHAELTPQRAPPFFPSIPSAMIVVD